MFANNPKIVNIILVLAAAGMASGITTLIMLKMISWVQ